jgi:uncharacterized protein (DUF2235 family)
VNVNDGMFRLDNLSTHELSIRSQLTSFLGLAEHIREAYSFICNNYDHGDEIILIGFSRGAWTARSIATLIQAIGLLNRQGLIYFYQIFQDWQHQSKPNWKTPYPKEPWEHRPPADSPEYRRKLLQLELTRPNITIKAIGVWDTVGGTWSSCS